MSLTDAAFFEERVGEREDEELNDLVFVLVLLFLGVRLRPRVLSGEGAACLASTVGAGNMCRPLCSCGMKLPWFGVTWQAWAGMKLPFGVTWQAGMKFPGFGMKFPGLGMSVCIWKFPGFCICGTKCCCCCCCCCAGCCKAKPCWAANQPQGCIAGAGAFGKNDP